MPDVYVGLGSNLDAARRLRDAAAALEAEFGALRCSAVYRSAAVGAPAPDYLNAVVVFSSSLPPANVKAKLLAIEDAARRSRSQPAGRVCALDLDLLLYGRRVDPEQRLPHGDLLRRAHVLAPLVDVGPDLKHPLTGEPLGRAWAAQAGTAALENIGQLQKA